MDYESFFTDRLNQLHAEGRYRVFACLERLRGFFPRAYERRVDGEVTGVPTTISGWGQHPAV
jgi:5-aminolevulinate synthase